MALPSADCRKRRQRPLAVEALEDRSTPTASAITASFNGTKIAAGNTIWFSSVAKLSGLGTSPVTLHVANGAIDFTAGGVPYHLIVPNGEIVFTPGATSASDAFDPTDNDWDVAAPSSGTGEVFLTGVQMPVTSDLPGGIKNIKWSGNFWCDTPGVTVSWSWAAAVYKSFGDYNSIGVKPVDSKTQSSYTNADQAGAPESFKASVTGGGTGGGGTNYTGNFTATTNVKASFGDGASDYPYISNNPLTSVAFNESAVLRAANLDLVNGNFDLWYNDEHALALGVRQVNVTTAAGTTTTNYPISPLSSNPGMVLNASVGSTATAGDQAGTDPAGRPIAPSLFITDITNNPSNRSGDWQMGGTAISPSAVFGTWKGVVRTVSGGTMTVTCDADPAKNNWSLGAGSDAPAGTLSNEGYGAEVRWSLADLQSRGLIQPGHNYRFYVIVHDGDQNKSGGDCGQASYNYFYPGVGGGSTKASISGMVQVLDDGSRVSGVTISLVDATGTVVATSITNGSGVFSFSNVDPGNYTLQEGAIDETKYNYWGNNAGNVNGAQDGTFLDAQDIGSIVLSAGDSGIDYVFNLALNSGGST
jgi:hypothetical protein